MRLQWNYPFQKMVSNDADIPTSGSAFQLGDQ